MDQKAGLNILGRARILSAMAMAYDWLYDVLPSRKRRRMQRFLDEEANRLYLFSETIVGDARSHNWAPWIAAGCGMAGIALRDEHKWARDWIDSAKRIFRVNLRFDWLLQTTQRHNGAAVLHVDGITFSTSCAR